MYRPYANIKNLYKELQDHKFIGGWSDGNDVFLWYRDNGDRKIIKITDVAHYFCVQKSDYNKVSKDQWTQWKERGIISTGNFSGDYLYILCTNQIRKTEFDGFLTMLDDRGIKPLEADLDRVSRLMIDLDLRVANLSDENPPKIAFYDIETHDGNGGKPNPGVDRILSVAWKEYDTGKEFFDVCESNDDEAERAFLERVYKALGEYDVLVGYNNYE